MTSGTRHDPYAPLRLSSYRRYLGGLIVLILGQQMQKVAVGWEIYERTGSALHLGYVGLIQFLPLLLVAIPAGHITDTRNRKLVLIGSLAITALAAAGLAWNSARHGSIATAYVLLLLTGTAKAFQNPARAAIVPRLVPREIFGTATSWNSSGFELASMAGPAIGGLIIGFTRNPVLVYLLNAASAIAFIVAVAGIPYEHRLVEKSRITLRALSAGMRFIWHQKVVMAAMTLDMFGVLLGGATTLMPVFAKDILGVGPRGLGWLLAAPSVGAFTTAMIQAHRRPYERAGRAMLIAFVGFGASTIVFGLSRQFWLSLAMLFLIGTFDNINVVIRGTLIQLLTPDEMRGRVTALNSVFIGTSNELGGFESGLVAGLLGPVASVVLGGIGTLLVVASVAHTWPQIRRFGKLSAAQPG
jgi:MFS family permease